LKGLRPGEDRTSAALFCGPATACLQPDPSYKCLRIVQIGRKTKKEGNEATNPHSHFDFTLSNSIYDVALLVPHLLYVHFSSQKSLLNSN